jgi:hypothetical protein
MATLTGNTIASTYLGVLSVSGAVGVDTVEAVTDGGGTSTSLSLSQQRATISLGSGAADDFIVDTTTLVVEGDNNRVGIGTAAPDGVLEVQQGASGGTTCLYIDNNDTNQAAVYVAAGNIDGNAVTIAANNLTTAHAFQISTAAALTTGSAINIESTGTALASTAAGGLVEILHTGDSDSNVNNLLYIVNDNAGSTGTTCLYVKQDSTGPAAVFAGGGVGIGIAPVNLLHVYGNASGDAATETLVRFQSIDTDTATDTILALDFSADANVFSVLQYFVAFYDSGGLIGRIQASSDGVVNSVTASDIRLKEDIKDTSLKGLNIINAIKLRDFKWSDKANSNRIGKEVVGRWVADEVYEVYPKAVYGEPGQMEDIKDEDGNKTGEKITPLSIASEEFIAPMMKAIQELSSKVEALENNNNKQGESSEQGTESSGGVESSESSGQDSGGVEGDSSNSSDATNGASEASESSSDDGNESSGSSGSDASDDSEEGSGGDDSAGEG